MRARADSGLPMTIYRPGIVVGDSATGETQKYDGPYFILRWLLKQPTVAVLPVPPGVDRMRVNFVPRDFVIGAIDALSTLPAALTKGLTMHHVPAAAVHAAAQIPPVGNLFAAFLGINPINALLEQLHVASAIPKADLAALTGKEFFPSLISGPFHDGLVIVFICGDRSGYQGVDITDM